jgi:hypothetical protein
LDGGFGALADGFVVARGVVVLGVRGDAGLDVADNPGSGVAAAVASTAGVVGVATRSAAVEREDGAVVLGAASTWPAGASLDIVDVAGEVPMVRPVRRLAATMPVPRPTRKRRLLSFRWMPNTVHLSDAVASDVRPARGLSR